MGKMLSSFFFIWYKVCFEFLVERVRASNLRIFNDVAGVYGVSLWKLLGKDRRYLPIILVLWLKWGPGLYFGVMFGVVILLTRWCF